MYRNKAHIQASVKFNRLFFSQSFSIQKRRWLVLRRRPNHPSAIAAVAAEAYHITSIHCLFIGQSQIHCPVHSSVPYNTFHVYAQLISFSVWPDHPLHIPHTLTNTRTTHMHPYDTRLKSAGITPIYAWSKHWITDQPTECVQHTECSEVSEN